MQFNVFKTFETSVDSVLRRQKCKCFALLSAVGWMALMIHSSTDRMVINKIPKRERTTYLSFANGAEHSNIRNT